MKMRLYGYGSVIEIPYAKQFHSSVQSNKSYCRRNYTDLVSIRDQTQNEAVKRAGLNSSTPFWTGLLRDDWEWTDGGRSAYRNWGTGQPRSSPSDCVKLRKGKWYSVPCSNNEYPLCYSSVSPADQSRLRTFHLIEERMNQSAARAACRTNYTDLVTVYSDEDNAALTNLINMSNVARVDGGWIGLTRNQSSDKWSNGADVTFSSLIGDCGSGFCCAAMKADGSWESLNCTEKRPFMCYKQASIHISDERMTWESALDYCRGENRTGLLRIQSEADQKEVEHELRRSRVSGTFWVGLGQSQLFGFWIWTDGTGVGPWTNWLGGRQPEPPLSHHCGTIDTEKGFKWRDKDCSSEFRVLCESTGLSLNTVQFMFPFIQKDIQISKMM
ncbi:hypothetical protein NFI96_005587 [Prochilodus magdalenae]|nr:hypothetical protein NFI96_005587 [Prochilodus magdalenae]